MVQGRLQLTPALLALITVLVVGAGVPPDTAALPNPLMGDDDDAGTGGDAPDHSALAPVITEGVYHGNVTWGDYDYYAFYPPPASVIRVTVQSSDRLGAGFRDPEDRGHSSSWASGGFTISKIAMPTGEWVLWIHHADTIYKSRLTYSIEVRFERHDHARYIDAFHPYALALQMELPEGEFTRIELLFGQARDASHLPQASAAIDHLAVIDPAGRYLLRDRFWGGWGTDRALIAAEHDGLNASVILPETGVNSSRPGWWSGIYGENATAGWEVRLGVADRAGVRITGWIVWDSDDFEARFIPGSRVHFARLSEFHGGTTIVAGPYGYTQESRSNFTVNASETALLYVDAREFTPAVTPAHFSVLRNGTAVASVQEASYSRHSWQENQGEWDVIAHEVNAWEEGRPRFMAASFPFPAFRSS